MLKLDRLEGDNVVVMEGLAPGESVVTVGGDKLREGTKVELITPDSKGAAVSNGKKNAAAGTKKTTIVSSKVGRSTLTLVNINLYPFDWKLPPVRRHFR